MVTRFEAVSSQYPRALGDCGTEKTPRTHSADGVNCCEIWEACVFSVLRLVVLVFRDVVREKEV